MTANQISYAKLLEERRHNLETEQEAQRSNKARETETNRTNVANEALTATRNQQSYETNLMQAQASTSQAETAKYRAENDPKTAITDGVQSAIGKLGDIGSKVKEGKTEEVIDTIAKAANTAVASAAGFPPSRKDTGVIRAVISNYIYNYDWTKPISTGGIIGLGKAIATTIDNKVGSHYTHAEGPQNETITGVH